MEIILPSILYPCGQKLKTHNLSRLQKVNFSVRGQANERCDGCNHLKSLVVRLSPLAENCEFRLFAGDSNLVSANALSGVMA
jgi:hypothetical protein